MKKTVALLAFTIALFSCDVAQQLLGTYQMTQCKYEYSSISNLNLAGVNLQNVSSLSSLNPLSAANLLSAFVSPGGALPLHFTLNLNVTNPGVQTALLNGMSYILEIDGIEMTQGTLNTQFQVASGQKTLMPIQMGFDLRQVLSGKSAEAIKNLAFNFAGIGNASSNVTVRLKPTFMVGGQALSSPNYIPVSFTLKK
jgi:LEA14-like dessication related protein